MRLARICNPSAAFAITGIFASVLVFLGHGPNLAMASNADEEEYFYGVLVDKPGVDVTYAYCAGCHSERIIAQQGLTRAGWEELLDWMIEEQGMGEIEDPDYTMIIDYLSEHYGEDRPNFPS